MRKLSELYQVVLDYYCIQDYSPYICDAISVLEERVEIDFYESKLLREHFLYGNHKHPLSARKFSWWKKDDIESRIEYLKYLIELCKEQDI